MGNRQSVVRRTGTFKNNKNGVYKILKLGVYSYGFALRAELL